MKCCYCLAQLHKHSLVLLSFRSYSPIFIIARPIYLCFYLLPLLFSVDLEPEMMVHKPKVLILCFLKPDLLFLHLTSKNLSCIERQRCTKRLTDFSLQVWSSISREFLGLDLFGLFGLWSWNVIVRSFMLLGLEPLYLQRTFH